MSSFDRIWNWGPPKIGSSPSLTSHPSPGTQANQEKNILNAASKPTQTLEHLPSFLNLVTHWIIEVFLIYFSLLTCDHMPSLENTIHKLLALKAREKRCKFFKSHPPFSTGRAKSSHHRKWYLGWETSPNHRKAIVIILILFIIVLGILQSENQYTTMLVRTDRAK